MTSGVYCTRPRKGDALIEMTMKIKVTIQQEGYAPYEFHVDKEGHDKDYPYQTFLRRPGHAGLSSDFESPETAGAWCGQWVKDYIEMIEEESKLRK